MLSISQACHGHTLGISWTYLGHILGTNWVYHGLWVICVEISGHVMGISGTYLWYTLGKYWVYHGHILKIGFQYISYHLADIVSIISIYTIISLQNTTISIANSGNCQMFARGWGLIGIQT